MSLGSSLLIGRSALTASQLAIQVTGNNFANAATPGYSRQIVSFAPTRDARYGNAFLGRGVDVQGINRQTDSALQARLWSGTSQESSAAVDHQLLASVESTINDLTNSNLSTQLSQFFNSWSQLANTPGNAPARALTVQQGRTLADYIQGLRADLSDQRTQIDQQLDSSVNQADALLTQIAAINTSIVTAEAGSGTANGLRDQRDTLISQLSQLTDVSAIEQPSGSVDILIGSLPVVLGGQSRGLEIRRSSAGGSVNVTIGTKAPPQSLTTQPDGGAIGALLNQRHTLVDETITRLDSVTSQLIFQVNRLHSAGYSSTPLSTITATRPVAAADVNRALNDPANTTFAGPPFHANNGGFNISVKNTATGQTQTVRINVDLDGINNAGQPGTADDTSVASLAASLSAVPNLSASVNPDGTLRIDGASGYQFSFSEDSSGALAVLGVNTYFTGTSSKDIGIRRQLLDTPGLLSIGSLVAGNPADNGAALAIAGLQDQANTALGGSTIGGAWHEAVQSVGLRTSAAATRADAASVVRQSLDAQRAAISGVSIDEESVNLLTYQRQYQGAAKFISVVDEMTQTLIQLV